MSPTNQADEIERIDKVRGHLAMLIFAALISGSFSIGHLSAPFIDPIALTAARFVLAAIVMSVLAVVLHGRLPIIKDRPWRFLILGGLIAFYFVMMFVALQIAAPVSIGAIFTLIPLMSAIFAWFLLRQRTSLIVFLGLLIGAAGAIWVIFKGDIDAILKFEIGKGEAIFFIGCVAHALYTPFVRRLNNKEPIFNFAYMTLLASTLVMIIWGGVSLWQASWANMPTIVWITIGYLAVFTTAGTLFLVQYASMRLPSSKVMAYGYLIPGIIAFYEGMLGHGWVNLSLLIGVFVTAIALVILAMSPDH